MKKILKILFVVVVLMNIFSCSKEQDVLPQSKQFLKSVIKNSSLIYEYFYENNQVTEIKYYDSKGKVSQTHKFTYLGELLICRKVYDSSNLFLRAESYEFDKNNLITKIFTTDENLVNKLISSSFIYDGKVIVADVEYEDGLGFTIVKYKYNSDGSVLANVLNSKNETIGEIIYKFDRKNRKGLGVNTLFPNFNDHNIIEVSTTTKYESKVDPVGYIDFETLTTPISFRLYTSIYEYNNFDYPVKELRKYKGTAANMDNYTYVYY